MITFSNERPAWTEGDAQNLSNFLHTATGQRFVGVLAWSRPEIANKASIEERALGSCKQEGYEDCLKEVQNLINPPKAK